jgi:plastocyanin
MKSRLLTTGPALGAAAGLALVLIACGGGGGYSGPPSTPTGPSNPGATVPTITIRAGGVLDPQELRIDVGQQVRFVNEDSQTHHPQSNPHLQHTDCPSANVQVLNPGQSATTAAFGTVRACGYHDHMNPDTTRLHGTIRVGNADGPTGPVYVVHD